ncbi:cytochrome P460 family protein [Flavobacterium sp. ENC]|uniref:cytochrome P460 family protein n=1 Tax=Flavobacterium sp. ENC TaxID=2897330 RepID=UPI001E45A659|nr:cytochrome P460 family protein [Flavobacterium sp. ENC]MCD0467017.1 cytochrome P460 family protein [Flavobacterium sp. ENC]
MKINSNQSVVLLLMFSMLAATLYSCQDTKTKSGQSEQVEKETVYAEFDADNNLIRPVNYRTWVFAGTATTPKSHDPKAVFPDFQNVYVDPVGYAYWKKHGTWKEGTILVKELLHSGDTISSVGNGFFQGAHFELAAAVKDSKRFPDMHEGWNYFGYADFKKNKLNEKSAPLGNQCASCHVQHAIDGDVFYQYYPVILAAKGYGDGNPENENTREGLVTDYKYKNPVVSPKPISK